MDMLTLQIKNKARFLGVLLILATSTLFIKIGHAIEDGPEIKDKTIIAQTLAEAVLVELDSGVYKLDSGYATTFKALVTQKQWADQMAAVRVPLGKVVSRNILSNSYHTTMPGAPDGEYVLLQYETEFENKKKAIETVTMMLEDKDSIEWKFAGYFIK